ncbi:PEFG-CTERM sorting domain-containing protein [Candidatus Nitrosopelagicus sp.]|nr:PEFG-CTERM sorting domain-containing protein [Candidatus Nitrosopelagicus sp.]
MNNKTISSLIVLLAITSMAVTVPSAFADHSKVTIVAVEGSGDPSSTEWYSPAVAVVDLGGEIIFSNPDMMPHSFSYGEDLTADDVGTVFDSNLLMNGQSVSITADFGPGDYPYFCMVHPWMTGLIKVQEEITEESHDDQGEEAPTMEMPEPVITLTAADITINVADGAKAGEKVAIDVAISGEHVNYDIVATHNGETILDESGNHEHDGTGSHETSALSADASDDNPIDVEVTFQGFGIPGEEFTGPIGLTNSAQAVPEFGAIAAMILAVAIVSIIAVSAKSRLSFMPRI